MSRSFVSKFDDPWHLRLETCSVITCSMTLRASPNTVYRGTRAPRIPADRGPGNNSKIHSNIWIYSLQTSALTKTYWISQSVDRLIHRDFCSRRTFKYVVEMCVLQAYSHIFWQDRQARNRWLIGCMSVKLSVCKSAYQNRKASRYIKFRLVIYIDDSIYSITYIMYIL